MPGDDEEDDLDDLENEFEMDKKDQQPSPDAMLHGRMNYGRMYEHEMATHHMMHQQPRFPLITDGQVGDSEDDENHALVVPSNSNKRVQPINYMDSNLPGTEKPTLLCFSIILHLFQQFRGV